MVKKKIEKIQRKRRIKKNEDIRIEDVPKITNDNVAQHREDIIKGARKYIYPLQHSKHKIVSITVGLLLVMLLTFMISSVMLLYRFQTTSDVMYQVTRVVPFPIARIGSTFVSYEDYLFELKHYIYYYENQQMLSFETDLGKTQLDSYKQRALEKVVNDAYIRNIAKEQGITVTDEEVDEQIRIAKEQNRLGSSDEVFEDVLRQYWNWSIDDFKRSLRTEILTQKVATTLDTEANVRAKEVKDKLAAGEQFPELVEEYSDDFLTKEDSGEFGEITKSNRNISQQAADVLFSLEPNEVSDIVTVPYGSGYALAIIRSINKEGNTARGAHIIIQVKPIEETLNDIKEEKPYRLYMNPVNEDEQEV